MSARARHPEAPLVVVAEELSESALAWLSARCRVERRAPGERGFEDLVRRARALVVRTYTRVDADLLDAAPELVAVGRAGVGLDNIDVGACRARGIAVLHTPDANTRSVAEYVFSLLHLSLRPPVVVDRAMGMSAWRRARGEARAELELGEVTLGIVGFGRIGSRVARIARGYGMPVVYHDLVEIPKGRREGARPASMDELLASADVLSLHVDAREENRGLLGREWLSRLKPRVVIVNTSRGMVVDPRALAKFLRRRVGALALLDVHEPEPIDSGYPLLGIPNAILTPHVAAATAGAHERMSGVVEGVYEELVRRGVAAPAGGRSATRAARAGSPGASRSSRKDRT